MKIKAIIISLFTFVVLLLFIQSTTPSKNTTINLSYTYNFKNDSLKNKLIGLKWALSYLGAELPVNSIKKGVIIKPNNNLQLNFNEFGFNNSALNYLTLLIDSLKQTEEYKFKKSIDIGEFITITIGNSWHYYNITGIAKTLQEFKNKYQFSDSLRFAVIHSSVAKHQRILNLSTDSVINKQAYIALESSGDIYNKTFTPQVYEVFDIMKNGQLRFAVYDINGNLITASDKKLGNAGKPAKCLWCHEIAISPLFTETPEVESYMAKTNFINTIKSRMLALNNYRQTLKSDIDFTKTQEHTQMELLYISYMEPSLKRLSQEWKIPEKKLKLLMQQKQTHQHEEFSFFGELYHRNDNLLMAPYKLNKIPLSVREHY